MDTTASLSSSFTPSASITANNLLQYSARAWFIVATFGLWMFAYYIIMFYGVSLIKGNLEHWNSFLAKGYKPGDFAHNLAFGIHVILAIVIIVGGPLQLIPKIREIAPRFHRWNGRTFVLCVLTVTTAGLYLKFTHITYGDVIVNGVANTINALLIYWFCFKAIKYIRHGNVAQHQRWMMRLFMATYAVWFFRIGLMFWVFVHQKPVGFDIETFTGPFLIFLGFAQYLVPLAILESYFYAQRSDSLVVKNSVSAILALSCIVTAIGIFAASIMMWLPNV